MLHIKYASLTGDGIIQGCCSCNKQPAAKVSEANVKRVILSEADGAYFEPGMGVLIGTNASPGRNDAITYNVTGNAGAVVTSVEKVKISDTNYIAVYVNTDAVFDTTADTTQISTFHWANGTTDYVLGNDGSPKDNTSGKYPGKIQGIEFMQGGYEVFADTILNLTKDSDGTYWYEPYVCRQTEKYATSITTDYRASGVKLQQPASNNWYYVKRLGYIKGVFFPIDVIGGSGSTYTRDAFSLLAATEDIKEWLARCDLRNNSALAGVAGSGDGTVVVGYARWDVVARLSPNGNRGEWNGGKEKK